MEAQHAYCAISLPCHADRTLSGFDTFVEQVQTGGDWDHKDAMQNIYSLGGDDDYAAVEGTTKGILGNVWSDVHYGYTGTEVGISETMLQEAADAGSLPWVGDHLEPKTGISTEGDRISIDIGIQLRRGYEPHELTAEIVHEAIAARVPSWVSLNADQICQTGVQC